MFNIEDEGLNDGIELCAVHAYMCFFTSGFSTF